MEYQSIHAPFEKMRHMWYLSEETDIAKQELKKCIADAAKYNVPIVVMHPFIGFDINESNDFGVQNFKDVVDYAKDNKIKIAFENAKGGTHYFEMEFADYIDKVYKAGKRLIDMRCPEL